VASDQPSKQNQRIRNTKVNKVSPQQDVTLLAHRRVLPPGELLYICDDDRWETTRDASDRY